MQGTNPPTFRPTVWPADPPDIPGVLVGRPLVPVEPGIYASPTRPGVFAKGAREGSSPIPIPPDFVLREVLDTAGASEQELVEFASKWGPPLGYDAKESFEFFEPYHEEPPHVMALKEAMARLGRSDLVSFTAIDEGLRQLRTLARHTLAHLEGQGDEAIIAAWEDEGDGHEGHIGVNFLWFRWDAAINRGLAKFSVHVRTENPEWTPVERPRPTLFEACCLQLAHYLASEGQVVRCANERCGRPFTRQRGRSREDYGQHRSRGVRYCSHLCAKAQSERDRRRRRSEDGKGS